MSQIWTRRAAIRVGGVVGGAALGLGALSTVSATAAEPTKKDPAELQKLIEAVQAKGPNKFVALGPYEVIVSAKQTLELIHFPERAKAPGANLCVAVSTNRNDIKGTFQVVKDDGKVEKVELPISMNRPTVTWCCGAVLGSNPYSYNVTYSILIPPA